MMRSETGVRYFKCIVCGEDWNVSKRAKLPADGYVCPVCMWRAKRQEHGPGRTK